MSKAGRKKKPDGDALRAADTVPPYDDGVDTMGGARKPKTGRKKASSSQEAGKGRTKRRTTKSATVEQQSSNIPQLDLDKQILAEQRKVASVRRKGPGRKSKTPAKTVGLESVGHRGGRAVQELSEEDQVIAEIVARDIERLCEG